ncbi:mitochondrial intermembrane space import and assembly protein 40-like [Mastomys coucha]|uniref:mitochondrial intermembrane space import and assembly protein 40-like n=1 Tax=Mastomys coucha TaxID=35658 RepID=UPI001261AB7A|nr:mitochondrial intermembrane space import and assembly protein 40-like [Mastomys coucha]
MAYSQQKKKDKIVFVSKEDHESPSNAELVVDDPNDPHAEYGLILPSGNINWNCPCFGGMASGPCGEQFKSAFSCFHHSTEEIQGSDCVGEFQAMQECMQKYPDIYPREENEDSDLDEYLFQEDLKNDEDEYEEVKDEEEVDDEDDYFKGLENEEVEDEEEEDNGDYYYYEEEEEEDEEYYEDDYEKNNYSDEHEYNDKDDYYKEDNNKYYDEEDDIYYEADYLDDGEEEEEDEGIFYEGDYFGEEKEEEEPEEPAESCEEADANGAPSGVGLQYFSA